MNNENEVYTKKVKGYGTFSSDKYPTGIKTMLILGCLFFFALSILSLILAISTASTDSLEYTWFFFIYPFFFAGFGFLYIYLVKKLDKDYNNFLNEVEQMKAKKEAEKKKFEEEHPHYEEEKFYNACIKANIKNVSDRANVERLKLVADKCGIKASVDELVKMFLVGQGDIDNAEREKELKKLRDEEEQLSVKARKNRHFKGRDKKIKMLNDMAEPLRTQLQQCSKERKAVRDGTKAMYMLGKGQEADSYLLGGIASGIAGGAAGLATALDVEAQNAETRAHNEALLRDTTRLSFDLENEIGEKERALEKKLEYYEKQIEETRLKLIEEIDPNKLLEMLNPSTTVSVSRTGSVLITVNIPKTTGFYIFDSVPAVIDGSLKLNVLKDGKKVGIAYACLPLEGSLFDNTIKTVCIDPEEKSSHYTVSIEPFHLWAIEK